MSALSRLRLLTLALACIAPSFAAATPAMWRESLAARAGRIQDPATRWVARGNALMQRSRNDLDPSLYPAAAEAYHAALKADPQRAEALVGLAWVHNSAHEFEAGRQWAEAALAVDPTLADAHSLIADGYMESGAYRAAGRHIENALDLRPDLSSYSRQAHLLWLTGKPTRALESMRRAVESGGPAVEHTAWCRAQFALMHAHAGDHASARDVVTSGLRLAPDNVHLLAADGLVRAMSGDTAGAIAALEKSIRRAPTHEALALLAELHAAAGDTAAAEQAFSAVLAYHEHHHHAHDHADEAHHSHDPHAAAGNAQLALFLADHDRDIARAVREAEAAFASFPNVFSADALAWSLFKAGRLKEARKASRAALRWDTPLADLHFHAGMILRASGELSSASVHFARALELNPAFHPRHARTAVAAVAELGAALAGAAAVRP